MKKKRYLLMLECELHQWAKAFGDQQDRSISYIVNRALRNAKNEVEKKSKSRVKVEIAGLDDAFNIFYSGGLPKKSKAAALKKFTSLVKEMKADPFEFANLLVADIQSRIANNQMGIDALHPSTYLNQQRWTDEHSKANNGQLTPNGKQSAAERIAARNESKYGHSSSGLGMAEGSGDLRGAMGEGERGNAITYVEPSFEQAQSIDCEEWD